MKEETTPDNFIVLRGGWNCGHELVPVSEAAVPGEIRERFRPVIHSKEDLKDKNDFSFSDLKNADDIISKFSAYFKQTQGYELPVEIKDNIASETYLRNNLENIIKLSEEYKLNIPLEKIIIQKMSSYGQVEDTKAGKILSLNGKNATYEDIARKLYANADDDKIKYTNSTHEFAHLIMTKNGRTNENSKQEEAFLGKRQEIWDVYKSELKGLTLKQQKSKNWFIGEYGSKDIEDFMAECFSEYKNSSNPTKYAKQMGKLIDMYFEK
jgi:hypothetical protein